MAISNASIGVFPSQTGGGGFLTVYDNSSTRAQIVANSYWSGTVTGDTATIRAGAEKLVSQGDGPDTTGTGILVWVIGSNGAFDKPYQARLSSAGRIQLTAGAS